MIAALRRGPTPWPVWLAAAAFVAFLASLSVGPAEGVNASLSGAPPDAASLLCYNLSERWLIQSVITSRPGAGPPQGAWSNMEIRRIGPARIASTGAGGCEFVVEVERLCDSGQPRRYAPNQFVGKGDGRVEFSPDGVPRLLIADVEIREAGTDASVDHRAFDLRLEADGARGSITVTDSSGNPRSEQRAESVSRSRCLRGLHR
jgi:hypothetical protein